MQCGQQLTVGSIIGVGIFNQPTSLTFHGPSTLVSVALTTVGALVLALLFASLSRRLPESHTKWISVLLVLVGLWIPALINLSGVKNMGSIQAVTTIYLAQRRHMSQSEPVPLYR
jgi:basic amino acid/polyamine antiporter, APA family